MTDAILTEVIENVLIIRFNRPEIRSPLSIAVLENLHEILDEIEENKIVETIIFTGAGDVFASGADLREIAGITKDTAREFALRGQDLMNKIAASEKLTIAAINGFCFGGALDLALSCKKRIASPNAQFSHPGANLGIITGWGGTQRLPRLIGEAAALEMFLTAKRVSAGEALRINLIDEIAENPLESALRILRN
jgi:enoyl-CoA hydratase/carnithine racemase